MKNNQGISRVNLTNKSETDVYSTFKYSNNGQSKFNELVQDLSEIGSNSFVLLLLGFSMSIPITMVIIGSIYINDCPIQRVLPLWLLIYGSVACLSLILTILNKIYETIRSFNDTQYKPSLLKNFKHILDLFLFGFFIAGNVIVYEIADRVQLYDNGISIKTLLYDTYCNTVCYLFAYWIIIVLWIIFAIICAFITYRIYVIYCAKRRN